MNRIFIKSTVSFYLLILLLVGKKKHQQAQCGSRSTLTFQKKSSLAFISFIPFFTLSYYNKSPIASQELVKNRRVVNRRLTRKVNGWQQFAFPVVSQIWQALPKLDIIIKTQRVDDISNLICTLKMWESFERNWFFHSFF